MMTQDEPNKKKATILIVEDEYILGITLQDMCEELGYHVLSIVGTIAEAKQCIQNVRPDLVLLDIMLGEEKGSELAEKVLNPAYIPFIYITSYSGGEVFETAKRTKPYGYLNKPVELLNLRQSIELALYKSENEDIKRAQQIKDTLLGICAAITSTNDRHQLLKIIFKKIRPIIPFDYSGLFITDPSGKYHFELTAEVDQEHETHISLFDLSSKFPHKDSAIAYCMSQKEPKIYDFRDFYNKMPPHPHFEKMLKEGIEQFIVGRLSYSGKDIGVLCFGSKNKHQYNNQDQSLFKGIVDHLAITVSNVLSKEEILRLNAELRQERDYLIEEVKEEHNFEEIVGISPALKEVFRNINMVAHTSATVLIEGETGTGKELIARAIHNRSDRKKKPMIKINCAAIPKDLIESELFGHEKGSFTGAFERRIGKFELAHNGTLFLDEIGEMPLGLQTKLLRVLQEKEIERLGGKGVIKINVRIIAATNKDLKKEVEKGTFRSDLYFRLNVFPIHVPALRDRKEDIPLLAIHFAQKNCWSLNYSFNGIKERAMQELMQYDWPGNIRELQNLVEQACILNKGTALSWARQLIPGKLEQSLVVEPHRAPTQVQAIKESLLHQEREMILEVLIKTNWRIRGKNGAASILNIKPTTLEYRIKKLGLK